MSNTARKARKRAREKFIRIPKEPTPFMQRSWFQMRLPAIPPQTKKAELRMPKTVERALSARGLMKSRGDR